MRTNGFTLIELLVVISIISILSIVGSVLYQGSSTRAKDSIRKNDLTNLAFALELYYQKQGEYIQIQGPEDCQRDTNTFYTQIKEYLKDNNPPKDPKTNENYCYIGLNNKSSYVLCAKLENTKDLESNNLSNCPGYNYSLSPKF